MPDSHGRTLPNWTSSPYQAGSNVSPSASSSGQEAASAGRRLRLAHVLEPRAGGVGVDQARAQRDEQLAVGEIGGAALAGESADGGLGRDVQPRAEALLDGAAG